MPEGFTPSQAEINQPKVEAKAPLEASVETKIIQPEAHKLQAIIAEGLQAGTDPDQIIRQVVNNTGENDRFKQKPDETDEQWMARLDTQAKAKNDADARARQEQVDQDRLHPEAGNISPAVEAPIGQKMQEVQSLVTALSESLGVEGASGQQSQALLAKCAQSEDLLRSCLLNQDTFQATVNCLDILSKSFSAHSRKKDMPYIRPARNFFDSFIRQNIDRIGEGLAIDATSRQTFNLLSKSLTESKRISTPDNDVQKKVSDLFGSSMDVVSHMCNESLEKKGNLTLINLLDNGDNQLAMHLFNAVKDKRISVIPPAERDKVIWEEPISTPDEDIETLALFTELLPKTRTEFLVDQQLAKYGLQGHDIFSAWKMSGKSVDYGDIVKHNLYTIKQLEQVKPHTAQVLTTRFNIKDFARYPVELLAKQVDQIEDTTSPYGIVITPRGDKDGAFYDSNSRELHSNMLPKELGEKFAIRFVECSNKRELVHILNSFRHKYGLISFGVVEGHGTPDSIQFGQQDGDRLTSTDLQRKGASAVALAFKENAPILLNSCSTGEEGKIAQQISIVSKTETSAPSEDSYGIKSFSIEEDETGGLRFHVEHDFQDGSGKSMKYIRGEKEGNTQ